MELDFNKALEILFAIGISGWLLFTIIAALKRNSKKGNSGKG
jgi:hypothetical protein